MPSISITCHLCPHAIYLYLQKSTHTDSPKKDDKQKTWRWDTWWMSRGTLKTCFYIICQDLQKSTHTYSLKKKIRKTDHGTPCVSRKWAHGRFGIFRAVDAEELRRDDALYVAHLRVLASPAEQPRRLQSCKNIDMIDRGGRVRTFDLVRMTRSCYDDSIMLYGLLILLERLDHVGMTRSC